MHTTPSAAPIQSQGTSSQSAQREASHCPPPWHRGFNCASDLTNLLKLAKLSRKKLAKLSGFDRHSIAYHAKRQGRIDGVAPRHFRETFEALGFTVPGWREPPIVLPPPHSKSPQGKCGAKTRKGSPCQCNSLPNGRCKFHGGLSTGPKTAEGKARIGAARRLRAERERQVHA